MVKVENFSEQEKLADDLERVGAKVEEVKRKIEQSKEKPSSVETTEGKKEIVKESVKRLALETPLEPADSQKSPASNGAGGEPSSAKASDDKEEYLPDYMEGDGSNEAVKNAVEVLLKITIDNGLLRALRKSKKYPPFIQDAFHDALADKLVPELEKRGKL